MADEITIGGLPKMLIADYKIAVKKMAVWNKAKGVIIFDDYKMEGKKKMAVGIPFRKEKEMEDEYKDVKKKKSHKIAKTAVCLIDLAADGVTATLEVKKGGLKPEALKAAALDVLSYIGIKNVNITGQSDDAAESEAEGSDDEDGSGDPKAATAKVQELVKAISNDSKALTDITSRLKSQTTTADDTKTVQALLSKINTLAATIQQNPNISDAKALQDADKIANGLAPQVKQLETKLAAAPAPKSVAKANTDLQKTLDSAREQVKTAKAEIEKMDKTLDKLPSSFLPSGKSILSAIGL